MDTRQVIARFEAERHALAMMDHPNIAKVLDAGTTESGRPYFVMELVKGIPITQYCDDHHLTPRQRLELFVQVCRTVQHAHQKGIIHRDLKPTNVLVAEYDDRPVPKIIDFGVAKAIQQRLTEKSMFTQLGQVVGTIDYMSPEQAKLNQLDIDTRSDIYSLGVLLYELLTGETPLDRQRLRSAAFDEMLRIIREEEPPKPSIRISTLIGKGDRSNLCEAPEGRAPAEGWSGQIGPVPFSAAVAALRKTEPAKLVRLVRGELDWIVMKALEKDRNRRYETANGFAADIERYLSDEPVLACPPSAAYRLRKFARRNKGPVVAVSLVLLALVAGIVGTTLGLLQARTAAQAEREAREAEAQQRQEAEASEKKASEEAAIATAVKEFLRQDLLGLAGAEAQVGAQIEPDPNLKLTTLLDRATAKVDEHFADQPRVRAEVQDTLAHAYFSIGRYADAVRLWEQVRQYGEIARPEHPATLAAMNNLAQIYGLAGQYNKALELAQQTLELKRKILGPEHPQTFNGMQILATIYDDLGRHADALKLHEETLELRRARLGPDHHDTLGSMGSVAGSYYALGRFADSLKLHEETLALRKARLGAEHPDTLGSMNNVASCYDALGRHADGLKLHEETLALRKARLGLRHPDTILNMGNVAICYGNLGRHADALKLRQETLALWKSEFGPEHPRTLEAMWRVAQSLLALDRGAEAVPIIDEFLKRTAGKSVRPGVIETMMWHRVRHADRTKDAAGWRTTAEMLEKLKPTDPTSLYNMACVRAVTAAVARASDKSDSAAKDAAADAERAMAWLKQAVAAGFRDINLMRTDKDLDALRDREDFKKLLTGLDAEGQTQKTGLFRRETEAGPNVAGREAPAAPPSLLEPGAGAVLANGSLDQGRTVVWQFKWSAVPGASNYHLLVIGATATIPLVDRWDLTSPACRHESRGYVGGPNRFGWRWKVRALVDGVWSPWSETRTFDVEPPGRAAWEPSPPQNKQSQESPKP